LLALASVLGVGEGHLLHRETRWVGSRYFAKSESLFQSFPNRFTKNDDPNRPGRDEQFAQVQHDLKEAMVELEEFWRKFRAGEVQVG